MQTENHYTETDLGNVSPNPRGNYDNAAKYEYLDLVTMQGGSYLCLAELGKTITGTAPEPGKTTEHWQCLAMPGDRTPEYTDAHDKVVRLAREVEQNTAKVAEDKQSVAQIETDTRQLKEQTEENARQAENSKDSAAGSARAAKTAEDSVRQAESNVRALVNGFDVHVAEKTTEATQAVATAKDNAVQAVERQETASVQAVKDQTGAYITEQKNLAKQELDNKVNQFGLDVNEIKTEVAKEGTKQVGIVQDAATTELAKITQKGTEQAGIVTKEGEKQVQAVQAAAQEIITDREQIAKNKADIAELRQGKADAIVETARGTTVQIKDSSDLPLVNLKIYGKSTQDGTPSPDTPIPIKSIGDKGDITVKITGRNLLDASKIVNAHGKIVNNGDGSIILKPGKNENYARCETSLKELAPGIIAGKKYILSAKTTGKNFILVSEINKTIFFGQSELITSDMLDRAIYFYSKNNGEEATISELSIEVGDVRVGYEQYKELQEINITFNGKFDGIQVDKDGNYTDEIGKQWICDELNFKSGKMIKRIERVVVDGKTNISKNEENASFVQFTVSMVVHSKKDTNVISTIGTTRGHLQSAGVWLYKGTTVVIVFPKNVGEIQDVAWAKKKLTENPIEIAYVLEKPLVTDLSPEILKQIKPLYSNKPTTVVINDVDAGMEVSYVADTKNYTDRKIEEAVSAQTQNLANLLSLMPLSTQAAMIETDTNNILKDMEVQK